LVCAWRNCLIERKKLLTCSWLTSKGVGGVVIMVVVLEVEKEEKDMNCYFVSFCSVFFYMS